MKYLKKALDLHTKTNLIEQVIAAYNPHYNQIHLEASPELELLRALCEKHTGHSVLYWKSFLLLLTDTTIETVTKDRSDGWHIDGSVSQIKGGACFNVWVPLYVNSTCTGLSVISADRNPDFYKILGQASDTKIYARAKSKETFEQINATNADFLFIADSLSSALAVSEKDLNIESIHNPSIGDLAIFRQTDIHRGFHKSGIRIQLSIKFRSTETTLAPLSSGDEASPKVLSRHGLLEAVLIREILRLNLNVMDSHRQTF